MVAPPCARILLVDADPAAGDRVRGLLGDGHEVVHEPSVEAALDRLAAEPADAVLLDTASADAVSRLRAAAPDVSVVLRSGRVDDDLALAALQHGAQDALRKDEEADGRLARAVRQAVDRTRALRAVRRATGPLAGVVDHSPDHVFVKDVDGRYVFVNAAWSRTWGLLLDDVAGRTDGELFGPPVARRHAETDRRALAAGGPVRSEAEHRGAHYAVVKFPLRDERGEVVGICGISSDVTPIVAARDELAAERARHRLVLANLPGMAVVLLDRSLHVMVVEGELARQRNHDPGALFGRHVLEAWPGAGSVLRDLEAALAGEERRFEVRGADGLRAEAHAVPQRGADGEVEGVLVLLQDVTRARAAEAARDEAQTLFRSAFDLSPIGMAITQVDGTYETVNAALLQMVGRDSLEGVRWQDLSHPDDLDGDEEAAASSLERGTEGYRREKRYVHADGHDVWVQVTATPLRDASGTPVRWFAQVLDITERKRFEARLERMAHHDALTGLLNRRGFERELAEHLRRMRRYGGEGALVVLDLDAFKVVNDTLGHHAGDELVVSAATALAARLRETDVLARLGGDEFAVLLPSADPEQAVLVAQDLCDAVRGGAAVTAGGRRRGITASAGVALCGADGRTGEALLAEADLAMYDAKEQGRDRVCLAGARAGAEPQMRERVLWLERLQGALEDERFVLHAQPVVDLATGAVHHHELLIRLPDGQGGLVPPAQFLPIAERAGLIAELDRWVLRRALRTLADERLAGRPRRFSVNLSARSVIDPAVLEEVELGLLLPGADPRDLLVELTETAAIGDVARAQAFAERLRELGVSLSLDDFGVGHGSLYELKHLPSDEVKLDGEFVRGCATSDTDRLVLGSLVALARAMGKRTVAEFVHDEPTAQTARALGVDLGQGFHLGRPVPLEEVLATRPARAAAA